MPTTASASRASTASGSHKMAYRTKDEEETRLRAERRAVGVCIVCGERPMRGKNGYCLECGNRKYRGYARERRIKVLTAGADDLLRPPAAASVKALTIQQPWAWAILHAGKDVENRSWSTQYRGPLAVHAACKVDREAAEWLLEQGFRVPEDLPTGAVLGTIEVMDVVTESQSPWFQGYYGWLLANPTPLVEPRPCRGRLGIWEWNP